MLDRPIARIDNYRCGLALSYHTVARMFSKFGKSFVTCQTKLKSFILTFSPVLEE